MSTKTLRKRIALVAVSAMGFGLLTSVGAHATAVTTDGYDVTYFANGAQGAKAAYDDKTASSGLLALDVPANYKAATATLLANGRLGIDVADTDNSIITVTNGTLTSDASDYINSGQTLAGANNGFAVLVAPNAGATTVTVKMYSGATDNFSTVGGTLRDQIVITVASTSTAGVYSSAKSKVNIQKLADVGDDPTGVDVANATTLSATVIPNGDYGYIDFKLKDAYGTQLPDDALVATATGGGLVQLKALGTDEDPTASTAVRAGASGTITVGQATANAPATVTVTLTYAGTVVATRSFTFEGEVAKVEAYRSQVGKIGSIADAFRVKYYDAAGTQLYPSDDTTSTSVVSTTLNSFVTAVTIPTSGVRSTATAAKGTVTCAAGAAAKADLQLQYVNSSGSIVKSNTWTQLCGDVADTYTASFDKTTYRPGEIATLSIKFLDSKGNLTNFDGANISSAGNNISISGAPAATAVNAPADADVAGSAAAGDAPGVKTYQFVVGTTEGDYQAVVSVPLANARHGAKQTVAYSIKANSTAISNAEVLAAVVKLIASINKQITALQKLLTKKK